MKICIIGAGVSGLAIGRLLNKQHEVFIYEEAERLGGIAKTKKVNDISYHMIGGHCFNSKNKEVMDFVFNEVMSKDNWHKVKRKSKIFFQDHLISYPIEYSIKEINKFDQNLAFSITNDFFNADEKKCENLADFFKSNFGETLANEYFIPYNRKIWLKEPSEISFEWVKDKIPLPNKRDFFKSIISSNSDSMPHNEFYYPNTNDQNDFLRNLGINLDIKYNTKVISIKYSENKWIINNEQEFDLVINTAPLNILPFLINNCPDNVKEAALKLKYNKISNVLWKSKKTDLTWTYFPSNDTLFHRHIHIGNFFNPSQNYTITEAMGEHSFEELCSEGRKFSHLIEPLDYNISNHAYVVFDHHYNESRKIIFNYLEKIGIYTLGRFGEWEYYNMDICIEKALGLYSQINNKI